MNWKKELSFTRSEEISLWGKLDLTITLFLILGLALNSWGIVFNAVTVMANDDTMPVITTKHVVLLENEGVPRILTNKGNLLLLADRIEIDFPDIERHIPRGHTGKAVRWWGKWLNYPFEGGKNFVSCGDLMRWSGSALFLIMIPLIILGSLRRIFSGDLPRIFT
ncbi:MAG: hypothetical protein A2494_02555 [Candidatus Lloydbacteria bacterium RIFOXYC12_FULL_46_25]|uniref:Uncharacterized protein n=1 Tax=Candidatus Lloydbacteria bacterium RIFOXYC12_FULL_46_25 TaxID=1798670 RepID=A0A1G2E109_9BACT|nr:MAG: hypothetical protein A2494_02555 [Candidatus Lloydbacteria bacterium RIFOXYC12_FULL_46_25]